MTKKDYELIAEAIKTSFVFDLDNDANREELAKHFAKFLEKEIDFDRERFLDAALAEYF